MVGEYVINYIDNLDYTDLPLDKKAQYKIINSIILKTISPYINEIRRHGLKDQIKKRIPHIDFDKKIISLIEKHFSATRNIQLGHGIGMVNIQYKKGNIHINPTGTAGLMIKEIMISDDQILSAIDDVIDQFESQYIDDTTYLMSKINEMLITLSKTDIYKPCSNEEKTIYDMILLILFSYYKKEDLVPDWVKHALNNFEQDTIIKHLISCVVDQISMIATNVTENIYVDLKLAFDSRILRITLNKKTNNGQISGLLNILGIDIDAAINEFVDEYMSPSFVKAMGQIVIDITTAIIHNISDGYNKDNEPNDLSDVLNPFNITITIGKDPKTSKAFRWFTLEHAENSVIIYSKNEDFSDSKEINALCEDILIPKTVMNLGPMSTYKPVKIYKYSAVISDLDLNISYYYKVGSKIKNVFSKTEKFSTSKGEDKFTFITVADSQGMIKHDYDVFLQALNASVSKFKDSEFICHLGDFVDDGNNEDYWSWILDDPVWMQKTFIPLAGNHEARVNPTIMKSGVDNSIKIHFNMQNIPTQDRSAGFYHSFVYSCVTFIVINTNDIDKDGKLSEKQYNWAIKTAKNASTKWKIALMHKSPYSNGPHHNDDDVKSITEQINSFCSIGGIDLVLAGHDHVYVRTPVLVNKNILNCKTVITNYNGINYETAINPEGTIFIVPGTTGVKNYKQDMSDIIPSEFMCQPDCPVYSGVTVDNDTLYFTAFKYNVENSKSELLDCVAIKKDHEWSYPAACNTISHSRCITVRNRRQFLDAIKNPNIKKIITDGSDIKIENAFGMHSDIIIDRDLTIGGYSKIFYASFKIKNKATLTLDDSVFIDNTRRILSCYRSINPIEIFKDSSLIIKDYATLRTEYGVGKNGYCIFIKGKNASVHLESLSEHYGAKGCIYSSCDDSCVKIFDGSYLSKRSNYSIVSNSKVIINGGKINNINMLDDSTLYFNGGTIGNNNSQNKSVPLIVNNKAFITGGIIDQDSDTLIRLNRPNAKLYIRPIHEGAFRIKNDTPFISNIKITDDNKLICTPNKYIYEPFYQDLDKFFFLDSPAKSFEDLLSLNAKPLKCSISSNLKAPLPDGDLYIFSRMLYSSFLKKHPYISACQGAKSYIFSKTEHINSSFIKKKDNL